MSEQMPLFASSLAGQPRFDDARRQESGPPVSLCVLGSGSAGNCSVVRCGNAVVMIDAGFGPRAITRRLRQAKLEAQHISTLCLTHLHQDHFRLTWISALLRAPMPVFVHRRHVKDLQQLPGGMQMWRAGMVKVFEDEPFEPVAGMTFYPIRLAHDMKGTCGFRIETAGGQVGYATDLGHVPTGLIDHFSGVDLLAIESNYDPQMQRNSGRPIFLQQRIMGKQGHLSNNQAFEAVCAIAQRGSEPQHIVLLHRSQQCNCPTIVRHTFAQEPHLYERVTLTDQQQPTPWLTAKT